MIQLVMTMRKLLPLFLALSLILCGCYVRSDKVLFQQSPENIVRVEFVDHENDVILGSISDKDELDVFKNDLSSVPCKKHFNDPPGEYGNDLILLYYMDGSIEILSPFAVGYINTEKEETMNMWYYLEFESFHSLFSEYAKLR